MGVDDVMVPSVIILVSQKICLHSFPGLNTYRVAFEWFTSFSNSHC